MGDLYYCRRSSSLVFGWVWGRRRQTMPKRVNVKEDPLWGADYATRMFDPKESGSVPGESVENELDTFIERESRKRQAELGEHPDRARAQAEWERMEASALERAEEQMEANTHQLRTWLEHLRRVFWNRHQECCRALELLDRRTDGK
jgi:hypothetical protein